ncbi:hypothetical protein CISG_00837 [Coccidioides immitis RMSCC 3703]|uniref:SVP1-like protein 2 n=1 Tax=Coccidioides immitis RMSCC 3703 TaxID=454286 RepID=A0A0J8QUF9_COCIT|nr:hypothetical protein CISG_00837 [Coccidioides immitis RMSCC 3703]
MAGNPITAWLGSRKAVKLSLPGGRSVYGTLIRVFATSNCAKIAELRRGLEHADIFSLGISPSNTLLAVTSDKSTLHVFDLPHARNPSPNSQPPQVTGEEALYNKWGFLGKIPLLPRLFSDVYSFASAPFEIGDETPPGTGYIPQLGSSFSRPPKGVIGWTSDDTLLLIGAGKDGRWERFIIQDGQDGKRVCTRTGWKRYLGS